MFFLPGEKQEYGTLCSGWEHSWLMFRGNLVKKMLLALPVKTNEFLPCNYGKATTLLSILADEFQQQTADEQILKSGLNILLRTLFHPDGDPETTIPERIEGSLPLLTQFSPELPLAEIAAQAGLSVSRFSELFKKYYHSTPIQYRLHQKQHEAEFLLRNRNLSIAEIAELLNFKNPFYFSTWFKKQLGISPQKYRNSYLKI